MNSSQSICSHSPGFFINTERPGQDEYSDCSLCVKV